MGANAAPAVVAHSSAIAESHSKQPAPVSEEEMVARYNEVHRYKCDVEETCQKLDEELTGLRSVRESRGAPGAAGDGMFSSGVLLMAAIVAISAYLYALRATD